MVSILKPNSLSRCLHMAKRIVSIKSGNVSPIVDFSRISANAERTFGKSGSYKGISLTDACGLSKKSDGDK